MRNVHSIDVISNEILETNYLCFRRRPAWTDRILHRVSVHNYEDLGDTQLDLNVENYTSYPAYTCRYPF